MLIPRTVVVSGGGTVIGRAIARRFALAGDAVVILGRRAGVLASTAEELNAEAGDERVRPIAVDLSRAEDVERTAAELASAADRVDVIVNSAGGIAIGVEEGLVGVAADWEDEYRRNVLTAVLLTSALEAQLRRPGASVINLSSIAALAGGGDSYSAAKAALLGWTLDRAVKLGPEGIRVNAVVPGYISGTEFFGDRMTEERHQRLVARTLLGRAGTPEDIAGCVFFLASNDAQHITGQLIQVNGGALLGR
jgi:NAD(P)-dependent dehydrogenase (short-subunit alcohol dehydrogenase family)